MFLIAWFCFEKGIAVHGEKTLPSGQVVIEVIKGLISSQLFFETKHCGPYPANRNTGFTWRLGITK